METQNRQSRLVTSLGIWKSIAALFVFCAGMTIHSPAQTFEVLASFDGATTGAYPEAAMVPGVDGNFYGTTNGGANRGGGSIFRLTPGGHLSALAYFCNFGQGTCPNGANPLSSLVLAQSGTLYGTAAGGGTNSTGTIYRITQNPGIHVIFNFCVEPDCPYGENPYAGLVQASDGHFYGTAFGGGAYGNGTIYKVTSSGAVTTI